MSHDARRGIYNNPKVQNIYWGGGGGEEFFAVPLIQSQYGVQHLCSRNGVAQTAIFHNMT